ncbi:MAG TPA: hypothetical protein VHL50_00525, partial [Pyrinomonadaceae bacterium]|nr:hypothetical protein [Pyrinomonadaceae bacterium]
MVSLERIVWMAVCVVVLASNATTARAQADLLRPGQPVSFSLSPGESRSFRLSMRQDDFAEIGWKAAEGVYLHFRITDPAGNELASSNSDFNDSAMFVAPRDGEYTFRIQLDKDSEAKGPQSISLQYKNTFKLPARSKQDAIRKINGYDVRIMRTPAPKDETGY